MFVECSLGDPSEGEEGDQVQKNGEGEAIKGNGEVVGAHAQHHDVGHGGEHRAETLSSKQGNHVIPSICVGSVCVSFDSL